MRLTVPYASYLAELRYYSLILNFTPLIRPQVEERAPLSAREGRGQIFFKPLQLRRELADFGIQFGELLFMGVGLLLERLRLRKQVRKVVEGLALPAMQLARMNLILGGNLRHRLFFLEHLEHDLRLECRSVVFLHRHNVSSVTLEAPPTLSSFPGPLYFQPVGQGKRKLYASNRVAYDVFVRRPDDTLGSSSDIAGNLSGNDCEETECGQLFVVPTVGGKTAHMDKASGRAIARGQSFNPQIIRDGTPIIRWWR